MDNLDKKILAHIQKNGRISLTELSDKVGLSISPCQRRLKQLEDSGVISGYRAEVNPERIGLNFSAIVFVKMKNRWCPEKCAVLNLFRIIDCPKSNVK